MKIEFKKLGTLVLTSLVVATSIFISCNKENDNIECVMKNNLSSDIVLNPKNPYDEIGVKHNSFLLKTKYLIADDVKDAITVTNHVLSSYDYDTTFSREIALAVIADSNNNYTEVVNKFPISDELKDVFVSIIDDIYSLGVENEVDYIKYKDIIVDYEDKILSMGLSEENKLILLSATSVLRHSLYYWNNEYSGFEDDENTKAKEKSVWKWIFVGVVDAAGAFGGAVSGVAVGGSIGMPITGGITGGIVGAVGASNGAAALYDKIDEAIGDDENDSIQ